MGQNSRNAILTVLKKHYVSVGISIINDLSDLRELVALKPDLVFLGMKFIPSNPALGFQDSSRIWIAKYLEDHGIAYTGSDYKAHELELNKHLAKQRILDAGLLTAPFYVAKQNQTLFETAITLTYPLFVKPTDRGGGMGIDSDSVVYNFQELKSKVRFITDNIRSDSLIEEYLPGREISVAILRNEHTRSYSVMPIERIVPPNEKGLSILSPDVKAADAGLSVAVKDKEIKAKVSALALDVFKALGAQDYARIDTRMDVNGTSHFLEANLLPSLIEGYGNFPKACMLNIQLGYEQMILNIVELGLARIQDINEDILVSDVGNVGFALPSALTA